VRDLTAALISSPPTSNSAPPIHPTTLLHQRLGHMGVGSMRTVISAKSIEGLPATFVAPPHPFATDCLPCIQGKSQSSPHPLVLERATRRGQQLHVDLMGPMPTPSLRGHRYCLTIVECFSRKKFTILLHSKADAKTKLMEFIHMVEGKTGQKVEHLHGDRGGEFYNDTLPVLPRLQRDHLLLLQPRHTPAEWGGRGSQQDHPEDRQDPAGAQPSPPEPLGVCHPPCNAPGQPPPTSPTRGKTPQELWSEKKPNVYRLRVWGSTGHVLLNKNERRQNGGKLGPVTKPCVLVGHNPIGPGWLLLDGDTLRECPSSDVAFQEHIPFFPRPGARREVPLTWDHFDSLEHSRANPPPAPPSSQTSGTLGVPPPSTPQGDLSATSGGAGGAGAGALSPGSGGVGGMSPGSGGAGGARGAPRAPHTDSWDTWDIDSSQSTGPQEDSPSHHSPQPPTDTPLQLRSDPQDPPTRSGDQSSAAQLPARESPGQAGPSEGHLAPSSQAPERLTGLGVLGIPSKQAEPRRSQRLQGISPSPSESLVSQYGMPAVVWALIQTMTHGESGDKKLEIPTPPNWQAALSGDYAAEWMGSMVSEVSGLERTRTFEIVPVPRSVGWSSACGSTSSNADQMGPPTSSPD